MGAGSMQLQPLAQLLATLKTACPIAETYSAAPVSYAPAAGATGGAKGSVTAGAGSSSTALSVAAFNKFLESFPGPLNASSSKDKVLKFLKDRLANYLQEEGLTDAPSWQVRTFQSAAGPCHRSWSVLLAAVYWAMHKVGVAVSATHIALDQLWAKNHRSVHATVFILQTTCIS